MTKTKHSLKPEYLDIYDITETIGGVKSKPRFNRISAAVHMGVVKGGNDFAVMQFWDDDELIHTGGYECKLTMPTIPERKKGRPRSDLKYIGAYLAFVLFFRRLGKKHLAYKETARVFGYDNAGKDDQQRHTQRAIKKGAGLFKDGSKCLTCAIIAGNYIVYLSDADREKTHAQLESNTPVTAYGLAYLEGNKQAIWGECTISTQA